MPARRPAALPAPPGAAAARAHWPRRRRPAGAARWPSAPPCRDADRDRSSVRSCRFPPRQGVAVAVVQRPDAGAVEPLLVDLEIGAGELIRRKVLDGEPDRVGGAREPLVAER